MGKSKKKQSQLAFVPLSPDSPAKQSQPDATRSRAAGVAFSPSPASKGKRTTIESFLPTPATSSQSKSLSSSELSGKSSKHHSKAKHNAKASSFMTRSQAPRSSPASSPPQKANINGSIINMFDDSESDDPPVLAASTPKRRRVSATPAPPATPSEEAAGCEESEELPSRTRRLKRPAADHVPNDDDDNEDKVNDEDDDQPPPTVKRRRLHGPKTSSKVDDDEADDLKEDLSFLRSDSPDGPSRYLSSDVSAKRKGKLSALEALKRSRQENTTPGRRGRVQVITDDEDEVFPGVNGTQATDESDLEVIEEEPPPDEEEANDDSFIVEDEGEVEQIPMEYKMQLMKTRELFEFAIEWMCQKRLNPAFAIEDDVYSIAFRRLNDFVKGLGGSKFQSSAWTAGFTRVLKARPLLEEERFINDGLHDRCDACNRSGHPPTFKVWFQGAPYTSETLEDESETENDYSRETKLAGQGAVWYLGKFCMANAKTAHTLAHWRYNLYQWVVEYLEEEGYLDAEKVLQRDRWGTKKRQKYANTVADQMKAAGVTKRLYKDFNEEIETAQNVNHEDYLA